MVDLSRMDHQPHRRKVVNQNHHTPQGQPITKPETLVQNFLFDNVNPIYRIFMAMSSIRFPYGSSKGKNTPGKYVIADTFTLT